MKLFSLIFVILFSMDSFADRISLVKASEFILDKDKKNVNNMVFVAAMVDLGFDMTKTQRPVPQSFNFPMDWDNGKCFKTTGEMSEEILGTCMIPFYGKQIHGTVSVFLDHDGYSAHILEVGME